MYYRKLGKKDGPNLGIIKCSQCGREWKWKDRCNNLKRAKCIPSAPSTSHPSAASSSIKHSVPLRRISGKQPDPKISSALTQRTGIGWVQQEGVARFVLRYSYKPELLGPCGLKSIELVDLAQAFSYLFMCSEAHYAVTFPAQMPLPVLQASYGTMVGGDPRQQYEPSRAQRLWQETEREATIPRTQFDLYLDKLLSGFLSFSHKS